MAGEEMTAGALGLAPAEHVEREPTAKNREWSQWVHARGGRLSSSGAERPWVGPAALIALRASDELKFHFQIARNNGLVDEELAEVIDHANGYAGFPAANTAKSVALAAK
jgi:alkylhydroperoxidase/carboxymuconolactone decarboxylase family protein YurZ